MGQKDSRPAHNAYTQPINDDDPYLPAPNVPKETIEFVMRLLMTLTPLYPDETLLFEDPQNGRTYINLPTEYFEEILNILPQDQRAKLRNAHDKATQRLRDDSYTPVSCIPTPDRPYLMVLVHLKCILRKWKDMYRDGDGDDDEADEGKPNDPPSSPPPPYTFSPPTQQNDDAQQQRQTSSSTTSATIFAHICSRSVPKGPILEQAPCASRHTVSCNVARAASLPGVVDQDEVSGGRFNAMTKPAQLFESKLQVRFPDVANIMTAYRDPDVTYFPLVILAINRPFNEQRPELGFFATTPKIVNGDLHLWTDCRIRASTSMELYEILAASRPETWLRPCRHLGASAYHRMPLRDDNLCYREFMAHAQRYGGFAARDENQDTKQNQRTGVSCEYCYTDCNLRMWKHESKDSMSFKPVTEYCLDIDVWHNLGAGLDTMETKWLGFVSATSFTTLKFSPPERSLGSVAKAYQY